MFWKSFYDQEIQSHLFCGFCRWLLISWNFYFNLFLVLESFAFVPGFIKLREKNLKSPFFLTSMENQRNLDGFSKIRVFSSSVNHRAKVRRPLKELAQISCSIPGKLKLSICHESELRLASRGIKNSDSCVRAQKSLLWQFNQQLWLGGSVD